MTRVVVNAVVRVSLVLILVAACVVAGGVYVYKGQDVIAPDWVRDRIQTRLDEIAPDARITFGEVIFVIDDEWLPRARVRDVRIVNPQGAEVVSFSELRATLAMMPLLDGKLELSSLALSGVFLNLRRAQNGAISLSSGVGRSSVTRQAPNLAKLVADLDDVLLRPGVSQLASIDVSGVTLRYEDERVSRAWTIDGGRLRLDRAGTALQIAADLAILGGGAQVATLSANYAGQIGAQSSNFGITFADLDAADIASQGPAFSWLQVLRAPISGALRGGVLEDGTLNPLNATFQIGAGVIQPTPESRAIPINNAQSYFTYTPAARTLRFDEFSIDSKWGKGRLEGQAVLTNVTNGLPTDLVGQFRLTDLQVNPADFYPEPIALGAAEMDFRLSLKPFTVNLGRLEVIDQGTLVSASGTLGAGPDGWDIALDAQVDAIKRDRLMQLWPEKVVPKTREWLSENLLAGNIRDVSGALRMSEGSRPETFLGFDFSGAAVRFLKDMPIIKDGEGHGTLLRDRLVLVADQGNVEAFEGGSIDISGSSFIIPDVSARDGTPAVIRLDARGGVTAALSMLDQPPLNVMQKADLPVAIAEGWADVSGTLALPLRKKTQVEEVTYDVAGTITDVRSDVLIKDRILRAPILTLSGSEEGIQLSGKGDLDTVPFDVTWTQPLGGEAVGRSQITGTAELSQNTLDRFKIALPDGSVRGQGQGAITIDLVKGQPPKLALTSDLRGLRLAVPPIGWGKGANTAGDLQVEATLSEVPSVDVIALQAPGLRATGNVALTDAGQLERVRLTDLRVGNWLNAPVDLVGRGPGRSVGVVLRGGTLDLRQADFGSTSSNAGRGGSVPLTVALNRLQITDGIAVENLRGNFTTSGGLDGTFQGTVNGGTPVAGSLVPQNGRSAIRLTASDAGGVFASAGLLQQARGGQMELVLNPVGTEGAFDGTLRVADIRVVDAPAMAGLLNAISVVGLVNQLAGDGIFFSEVDADFRLTPDRITLREASATGSSIGISMDGIFLTNTQQLQMQGVISPVYLLNRIGSIFTRAGEGLIGFNYTLSGTAREPDIFVNPLTALTPGGLRDLFRAEAPEIKREEGEAEPPPPPPAKPRRVFVNGSDR